MKKLFVIILVVSFMSVFASDFQQPVAKSIDQEFTRYSAQTSTRSAPNVEFSVDPIIFAEQYYDYMHGGYNSFALRKQPEYSAPDGFSAAGMYFPFMYQENASTERRIYYIYIDSEGNISTPAPISSNNLREGFASIDIDPLTANPLISWHSDVDDEPELEVMLTYDAYCVIGNAGLWKLPYVIIDNPHPDFPLYNEFVWPIVQVGVSPETGKRRAHLYANYTPPDTNTPAEYNIIYGYTDFYYDADMFDFVFTDWQFKTFPVLDELQDNEIKRAIKDMIVSKEDGKVAFIGHLSDSLFCLISDDYGETFEYHAQNAVYDVFDPTNADDSYFFLDDDDNPLDVIICANGDGGHYNAEFVDNETKIIFMSAMGINTVETLAENKYYAAHFHPKIFRYDIETSTFEFVDMQLIGVDPNDDQPMISYDLDEDGIVDNHDPESGSVMFADCWPTYYYADDAQNGSFHESFHRIVTNNNRAVAIWMEGSKAMNAYYEIPGYEDWFEVAEIMISVSIDFGETWSEPRRMNAKEDDENYYSELYGMKPCYIYPADELEIISDTHALLPIIFFDDNSYGSFVSSVGDGLPNGGKNIYAVLDIDFSYTSVPESELAVSIHNLQQNYPNPFNPTTTINYNLKVSSLVNLDVYNMRGQKIKTLVNNRMEQQGEHSAIWNGDDDTGKSVASGIYFYKLRTGKNSSSRKMILMK